MMHSKVLLKCTRKRHLYTRTRHSLKRAWKKWHTLRRSSMNVRPYGVHYVAVWQWYAHMVYNKPQLVQCDNNTTHLVGRMQIYANITRYWKNVPSRNRTAGRSLGHNKIELQNKRNGALKYQIAGDTNCAELTCGQRRNSKSSKFKNPASSLDMQDRTYTVRTRRKKFFESVTKLLVSATVPYKKIWRYSIQILEKFIDRPIEARTTNQTQPFCVDHQVAMQRLVLLPPDVSAVDHFQIVASALWLHPAHTRCRPTPYVRLRIVL